VPVLLTVVTIEQEKRVGGRPELGLYSRLGCEVEQPIEGLSEDHSVVNVNASELFDQSNSDEVGTFGRFVVFELRITQGVPQVWNLLEPVVHVGAVEMPQLPAVLHQFMVVFENFKQVVQLRYFGFPYCPNYFRGIQGYYF
jgi:hypothetical protein